MILSGGAAQCSLPSGIGVSSASNDKNDSFETRSAQSAPRSNDGGIWSERRAGFRTLHQTDQMRPSQLASPLQITHMSVMTWAALQDPGTSIHNTPKYYIVSTDVILLSLPTSIDLACISRRSQARP